MTSLLGTEQRHPTFVFVLYIYIYIYKECHVGGRVGLYSEKKVIRIKLLIRLNHGLHEQCYISFLCFFKIDVTLKFIIEFIIDHY